MLPTHKMHSEESVEEAVVRTFGTDHDVWEHYSEPPYDESFLAGYLQTAPSRHFQTVRYRVYKNPKAAKRHFLEVKILEHEAELANLRLKLKKLETEP